MAYNNYFPATYQPAYQPYQAYQQPQTAPQQTAQNNSIIWVQGEAGAKSYLTAPGQSVLLMDSEENRFYIKSSDASGMPQPLRAFTYSEESAEVPSRSSMAANTASLDLSKYITRDELEERLEKLVPSRTRKKEEADG